MRRLLILVTAGSLLTHAFQIPDSASGEGQPRIYFAEIDAKFSGPMKDIINGWEHLGKVLSADEGLWTTLWYDLDKWWLHQLYMSPHRVQRMEDADIVFVPAHFRPDHVEACREFFTEYAPAHFPALSEKPHVMVPSSFSMSWEGHRCWGHDLFLNFTIMTIEPYVSGWQHDFNHWVGVPMMGHVHQQHMLTPSQGGQNLTTVEAGKHRLVFSSYVIRGYPTRIVAHQHCLASPHLCKHVEWKEENSDALLPEIQKGYEESWFTVMPRADFKLRNSLFDALLAPSIPIVFDADYAKFMPFSDILDYNQIFAVIDGDRLMGDGEDLIQLVYEGYNDRRMKMIDYILSVRHLFQYKLYPRHHLVSFRTREIVDVEDDAFTLSMKALLSNICRRNLLDRHTCGV